MVSRSKDIKAKSGKPNAGHLMLQSAKASPLTGSDNLHTVLEVSKAERQTQNVNWALKEVECAREFNFELPEDIPMAVRLLEQAVQNLMGTEKSVILLFDENTGVYTCLNDEGKLGVTPREVTRIADGFIQELMGSQEIVHTYLLSHDNLIGLVAVADKMDGSSFNVQDQVLLDLLTPYLVTKVLRFRNLKQSLSVPYIQSVVLEMAANLVSAVDQDEILGHVLSIFHTRLGFDLCQFARFNTQTGEGEILCEATDEQMYSYTHAGLAQQRKTVDDYAHLVSLLSSTLSNRFYLHIKSDKLGDQPLDELFGVKGAKAALVLPVLHTGTGEIIGTINLIQRVHAHVTDEALEIAKEVALLASRAMSRAMVLEKALDMASTDELTGLLNRRAFYHRFEAEIERGRRQQSPLCVALLDVDYFKRVNDEFGHLSGDRILQALANLFAQNVRKSDVVCRFGGEEFAILLPDTSLKDATELLERIRQQVARLTIEGMDGQKLKVTISAGLSMVDTAKNTHEPYHKLISKSLSVSDEELYRAKAQGRNQIAIAQEL